MSPDQIHLIFTPLRCSSEFAAELCQLLSTDEHERASRFRSDRLRDHFTVARGMLRIILGRYAAISPGEIRFQQDRNGKPALAGGASISFNLAHSDDLAVYAVASRKHIGVDIERVHVFDGMDQIARRYFCTAEYRDLVTIPEASRTAAFFRCWTRKEAFVKAMGEGLTCPLGRFEVTLEQGSRAALAEVDGSAAVASHWSVYDVAPSDDYAAALITDGPKCPLRAWHFGTTAECAAYFSQIHSTHS